MSSWVTVSLPSSGKSVQIKKLSLFELEDELGFPELSPFTVTVVIDGKEFEQVFDLSKVTTPPQKPEGDVPPTDPSSPEFWSWKFYHQYQAALLHDARQRTIFDQYRRRALKYVRSTCIPDDVLEELTTLDDWRAVITAALPSRVSLQDLREVTSKLARVSVEGSDLFDELFSTDSEGPEITYQIPLTWELEALAASSLTEESWSELSTKERARRIVGLKISDWLQAIHLKFLRRQKEPLDG